MLRVAPQHVFHNPKRKRGIAFIVRSVSFDCAVARQHVFHNPKRKRGIALPTIRTGICVLAHDVELGHEVDNSAEESLAYASGCERSAGIKCH